jgi:1-acyl-sn-glycerol-3-phosphate acyltransferase
MTHESPLAYEKHWTVRALFGVNRMYARIWHHVEMLTPCPLPPTGPAILICNHSAGLDPFLLQATCPRLITWMMAKEYYELPILNRFARHLQYIPVKRDLRDSASLRTALRALRDGKVLGVFPEGKIAPSRKLLEFQGGVEVMAQRESVPVYPAYIGGLPLNVSVPNSMFSRQVARIAYGPPMIGTTDNPLSAAELMRSVDGLKKHFFAHSSLR